MHSKYSLKQEKGFSSKVDPRSGGLHRNSETESSKKTWAIALKQILNHVIKAGL